jgi:hypothetical protein
MTAFFAFTTGFLLCNVLMAVAFYLIVDRDPEIVKRIIGELS